MLGDCTTLEVVKIVVKIVVYIVSVTGTITVVGSVVNPGLLVLVVVIFFVVEVVGFVTEVAFDVVVSVLVGGSTITVSEIVRMIVIVSAVTILPTAIAKANIKLIRCIVGDLLGWKRMAAAAHLPNNFAVIILFIR